MAKLAAILRAEEGWDAPWSQPADRVAVANYSEWFSTVPAGRELDAEPMLTDEGNVRLEWFHPSGRRRIAEIGASYMYLAELAARFENSEAVELETFDAAALTKFFLHGALD